MRNTILTIALAAIIPLAASAQTSTVQQSTTVVTKTGTVKQARPIVKKKVATVAKTTTTNKTTTTTTKTKPGMNASNGASNGAVGTTGSNGAAGTSGNTGTTTTTKSKPGMDGTTTTGGTGTTTTTTNGKPGMDGTTTTGTGGNTTTTGGTVSQSDASSAIKQALINGITTGVNKVSVANGYFGNPEIKIPLPSELQPVDAALRNFGAGQMVDKLVEQLNHSAEQAASQATPIFLSSINQLTITNAINIISNKQQDAATMFLKRATTEQLVAAFKPKIKSVLDQTKTNEVYGDVMGYYNKIPFVSPIETDLSDYVTRRALDGLFVMIAKEEAKIRQDPKGQVSNIINTVFGKLLTK